MQFQLTPITQYVARDASNAPSLECCLQKISRFIEQEEDELSRNVASFGN